MSTNFKQISLFLTLFLLISPLLPGCEKQASFQTTGFVDDHLMYLSSPYGGYLDDLLVTEGEVIHKGQLLLKLNGEPEQQELAKAQSEWRAANKNLDELKKNKGMVSQNKIDAQKDLVSAALSTVKLTQWAYDVKHITAPEAGTIADIFFQQGEYVPPLQPVVTLLATNHMRIIFYVPEAKLSSIHLDKPITIIFADNRYSTKVISIAKQAEYTPDAMFSERNRHNLVFKIIAEVPKDLQNTLHGGQPVDIDYE